MQIVPYAFGSSELSPDLFRRMPADAAKEDPLQSGPFGYLVNAANAAAFGDLGMPLWVQLDCATLPSAYHGFAAPRDDVPDTVFERVMDALGDGRAPPDVVGTLEDWTGLVPLSGYCAARTARSDTVVGFSLFSLVPGLGVRSKALGLFAHGAARQIGVAQYDNPVVRAHCAFGRLKIVAPVVATHTRGHKTFVYEVELPALETLEAMAFAGARPVPHAEPGTPTSDPGRLRVDAQATIPISGMTPELIVGMAAGGSAWIVPPGRVRVDGEDALIVATDAPRARGGTR